MEVVAEPQLLARLLHLVVVLLVPAAGLALVLAQVASVAVAEFAVLAVAVAASAGAGGCCRYQAFPVAASAAAAEEEVVVVVSHYLARLVPACRVQVLSHSQEASVVVEEERLQDQPGRPLDNQAGEAVGEEASFHQAEETWASVEEAGAEAVPAEEASAAAPAAAGS